MVEAYACLLKHKPFVVQWDLLSDKCIHDFSLRYVSSMILMAGDQRHIKGAIREGRCSRCIRAQQAEKKWSIFPFPPSLASGVLLNRMILEAGVCG